MSNRDPYLNELAARLQAINPDARAMSTGKVIRLLEIIYALSPTRCFAPSRLMSPSQGAATLGLSEEELNTLISIHEPGIPFVQTASGIYYKFGDLSRLIEKATK